MVHQTGHQRDKKKKFHKLQLKRAFRSVTNTILINLLLQGILLSQHLY